MITRMISLNREQRGITGLETAIIMIAFVVVASVFAYTVLSAGVFSAEKGKQAIHAGLAQARSSMELVGPVVAKDTDDDDSVDEIVFIVANSLDGEPINLTVTPDSDNDGRLDDETALHTTIFKYIGISEEITDIAWSKVAVGKGDTDDLLEPGEKFEITVNVSNASPSLDADDEFIIEIDPESGSTLVIERRLPPVIDKVTDLN
ncbi:MAG: archaellin/type IV pilin N-terminal domain-containing protein [Dehalococcoidia bacterium]